MKNSVDKSKEAHRSNESSASYWAGAFDPLNDDTKRHLSLLSTALPLLQSIRPKNILTIGDNRGRDAFFFKDSLGCHSVASDLDISKLIPAKNDGFISDCVSVDVENIPFEENAFDIVLAKESFHHWPRPMLGLYEMLRVSKFGIILIEPNDCIHGPIQPYPDVNIFSDQYEDVGNYKYQISVREVLKASWSLYLDRVLVKGFNDPYTEKFKFDNWIIEKDKLDLLGENGTRQFNLVTIFIEKESNSFDMNLLNNYYKLYTRPQNPFTE